MKNILEKSNRLISSTSLEFIRSDYNNIAWNQRLVGIVGARGIGKTTLLLQHLKQNNFQSGVYFSADSFIFFEYRIYEIVEKLYLHEGKTVFYIDEIHKYKNWNQEIKNLYDSFVGITIYFSGSSSIDLVKGSYDLSRRAVLHKMQGLSFREYLECSTGKKIPIFSLSEILLPDSPPVKKIYEIFGDTILFHFKKYTEHGYYPFFIEGTEKNVFSEKLFNALEKIFYEDISSFYSLKTSNIERIKKIFLFYSLSKPGDLSINALKDKVSLSYDTTAEYVQILYEIGLLEAIFQEGRISRLIRQSKKLFIDNPNILNVMGDKIGKDFEKGTMREVFFLNQVKKVAPVFWSTDSDFLCQGFTLEVGGRSKSKKQIQNIEKSFLVKDDILFSSKKEIPLWIFGFLY